MPSWQARCCAMIIRTLMRRLDRSDAHALVRRARRVFGVAPWLSRLRTHGVRIEPVQGAGARGEWIVPERPETGLIFYIHGGGYVACSAATHRTLTAALARLSRRRVFAVDYRLAPEHPFPAALDDVVAGYHWVAGQGIPPGAIALAGDSAGGGLVLATLLRLRDSGAALPAAAVCFSPWTDLTASGASIRTHDGRDPMFRSTDIARFAAIYLAGTAGTNPYASPVFADLGGLPPVLLQVAAEELLLDDSRRVHEAIQKAGGVSRLDVFPGMFHVWQMLDGLVPEARVALERAAAFIQHGGPEMGPNPPNVPSVPAEP
jgi:epsilon-lactone hydrolase